MKQRADLSEASGKLPKDLQLDGKSLKDLEKKVEETWVGEHEKTEKEYDEHQQNLLKSSGWGKIKEQGSKEDQLKQQQMEQQKQQPFAKFLEKAGKNGWDTSKNGDRDFLENVYKSPGLARVAKAIEIKPLNKELPAADKVRFANSAVFAASQSETITAAEKEAVKAEAEKEKKKVLGAVITDSKIKAEPKTPEENEKFLATPRKMDGIPTAGIKSF